jgi:hypothetical protein
LKIYRYELPDGTIIESVFEYTPAEIEAHMREINARFAAVSDAPLTAADEALLDRMDTDGTGLVVGELSENDRAWIHAEALRRKAAAKK